MQANKLGYEFPVSLYVEVPSEQHGKLLPGWNGRVMFAANIDCSPALSLLEQLQNGDDLVPVLLGDPDSAGAVRWLAVLGSIQKEAEQTLVSVTCLEELGLPIPLSELMPYGSGTRGTNRETSNCAAICTTPGAVADYLTKSDIQPAARNPLLFEKCILFHQTPLELLHTKSGQVFRVAWSSSASWENLTALLHEARVGDRVLNGIFPNPARPSSVGWVVIVRDVNIAGGQVLVTYQMMFDFRKIKPAVPIAIAFEADKRALGVADMSLPFEVCEQSWLVNDCLHELSRETTSKEFEEALSIDDLTLKHCAMLCFHHAAPNQTMSMDYLANLMGFKNFYAANLHYGRLAGHIGERLGRSPEGDRISVLAYPAGPDEAGNFQWKMRPQLAEALENLGWVPRPEWRPE